MGGYHVMLCSAPTQTEGIWLTVQYKHETG